MQIKILKMQKLIKVHFIQIHKFKNGIRGFMKSFLNWGASLYSLGTNVLKFLKSLLIWKVHCPTSSVHFFHSNRHFFSSQCILIINCSSLFNFWCATKKKVNLPGMPQAPGIREPVVCMMCFSHTHFWNNLWVMLQILLWFTWHVRFSWQWKLRLWLSGLQ